MDNNGWKGKSAKRLKLEAALGILAAAVATALRVLMWQLSSTFWLPIKIALAVISSGIWFFIGLKIWNTYIGELKWIVKWEVRWFALSVLFSALSVAAYWKFGGTALFTLAKIAAISSIFTCANHSGMHISIVRALLIVKRWEREQDEHDKEG